MWSNGENREGNQGSELLSLSESASVLPLINKSVSALLTHLVKGRCLELLPRPTIGKVWMRETDASAALSENEKELVAILYYSTSAYW